jgi:Lamin Tail Domain
MSHRNLLLLLVLVLVSTSLVAGCNPVLPGVLPDAGPGGASVDGGSSLTVTSDPPASLQALPPVLELVASSAGGVDPSRLTLFEGTVGPEQLGEVVRGELSTTLGKRVVPALTWAGEGGDAVLAPEAALTLGKVYTLVAPDLPDKEEVQVAATDPLPALPRIWPPPGEAATVTYGVWCGDTPLARVDTAATLRPGGPAGRIRLGAVEAGAGAGCLRFEADPDATAPGPGIPPSVVVSVDGTTLTGLDPQPFQVEAPPSPASPLACSPDETPFGPGCVQVEDDRVAGRAPAVPLLWAVAGAGADQVFATGPGDPFVVAGLPPGTFVTLDVGAVDNSGTVLRSFFTATTADAAPHVAINEVYAWPLGARPGQEWVEIINDGPVPVDLGGYVLLVDSTPTTLPEGTLSPGGFALIVNAAFSAEDGLDPSPAPGTLILSVPKLGKTGLTEAGEPFTLLDGTGTAVSAFLPAPKPKEGWSVDRRTPWAPDTLAGSFALAKPSPGRKNLL